MSGLASLTANYTDSEDEGSPRNEDEDTRDSISMPFSGPPSNAVVERLKSATATPTSDANSESNRSGRSTPTTMAAKKLPLVSYEGADDDQPDDEGDDPDEEAEKIEETDHAKQAGTDQDSNAEPVPMDLESDAEEQQKDTAGSNKDSPAPDQAQEALNRSASVVEVDAWTDGGMLPPEVDTLCSPRIQESVNRAMRKKLEFGYDMNAVIQNKKAFRNPSIYEKLIQYCEIDEHGTNFPKELYDGHLFGKESYYDELAKVQKVDMERREKLQKEKSAKGEKRSSEASSSDHNKRKSKWDQVGPQQSSSGQVPVIRPGSSAVSSSKTIPAFGSLKK